jgi:hypothetical protein
MGRTVLFGTPEEFSEADKVMVWEFLNTLAEVAVAVASRKNKDNEVKQ